MSKPRFKLGHYPTDVPKPGRSANRAGVVAPVLLCLWLLPPFQGVEAQGFPLRSGEPGFGEQWVRSQPIAISATSPIYQDSPSGQFVDQFWDTHHTIMVATERPHLVEGWTQPRGRNWIRSRPELSWTDGVAARVRFDMNSENLVGWLLNDEPSRVQMAGIGTVAEGIRSLTEGRHLVYANINHGGWEDTAVYDAYLDTWFAQVNPDILMYDIYPFANDQVLEAGYLQALMRIRNRGLAEGVPYWAYLQGFATDRRRVMSESDLRMNVYSHLVAGFTGFMYFVQNRWADGWMVQALVNDGVPGSMYPIAQDVNVEAQNLGRALRFLRSREVFFIPGSPDSGSPTDLIEHWAPGNTEEPHIIGLSVDGSRAGEDGLIGTFTDDGGRWYFMLVNMNHAAGSSAASKALVFTVTFDTSVNELLQLNRVTGEQEMVPLTNHTMISTLPGGTGALFKYSDGVFPGIGMDVATAVEQRSAGQPAGDELFDAFPNPFNDTAVIPYSLSEEGPVTLDIYNLAGQRVRTLVDVRKRPGAYRVVWDGTDDTGRTVASGIYFVRLAAGEFRASRRLLVVH